MLASLSVPLRPLAMLAALALWVSPPAAPPIVQSFVFPLSISGKSWQTDVLINPGVKPPIGKVNDKAIQGVLQETLPDFAADFLNLDDNGAGLVYVYYDGRHDWRLATNPNGAGTTALQGAVANDGQFWMSGDYTFGPMLTDGRIFVQGKVTFAKGTLTPTKISGNFYFVSNDVGTGLTLKFKTGKVLP